MNIENLLLFIYEVALLKDIKPIVYDDGDYMLEYPFGKNTITPSLISQINLFFENTFLDNKELFEVIFTNIDLFEDFIIGNYEILDYQTVLKISTEYEGIDGYMKLISEVDKDSSKKINQLAIKFLEYYQVMLEMYNEKYTDYRRILQ